MFLLTQRSVPADKGPRGHLVPGPGATRAKGTQASRRTPNRRGATALWPSTTAALLAKTRRAIGERLTVRMRVVEGLGPPERPVSGRLRELTGRLLVADEVAEVLHVPRNRVYALRDSGRLPAIKLGRDYRWDPAAVARFLDESLFPRRSP